METTKNEMISQQYTQFLRLKRPLLSIDEYAAREEISVNIVEQRKELGVIQIRKFKDKAFVVDIPVRPFEHSLPTSETTEPLTAQVTDQMTQTFDEFRAVEEEFGIIPTEQPEKISTPELEEFEIFDEPYEPIEQLIQIEQMSHPLQQSNGLYDNNHTKLRFLFKATVIFSFICFFTGIFINLYFYLERKIQLNNLNQAYMNVQKANGTLLRNRQYTEILQNELGKSKTEVRHLQSKLNKSETEIQIVRSRIRNLNTQLTESTKNP